MQSTEKITEQIKEEFAEKQLEENKVISIDGSDKTPKDEMIETAKRYFTQGFEAHNRADFNDAIALFSKCLEIYPEYLEVYQSRGMSKYKSGNQDGACVDWQAGADAGHSGSATMLVNYCN